MAILFDILGPKYYSKATANAADPLGDLFPGGSAIGAHRFEALSLAFTVFKVWFQDAGEAMASFCKVKSSYISSNSEKDTSYLNAEAPGSIDI